MKALLDEKIIESWEQNVDPWIVAIRKGEIGSRVQTTNQAILETVLKCNPKSVLNLGSTEEAYKDGWRRGSWAGFNRMFSDPAPWYFRTLDSSKLLFESNGFKLEIIEPINKESKTIASIVFIGKIDR